MDRFKFRAWHRFEGMTYDYLVGPTGYKAHFKGQGGSVTSDRFDSKKPEVILMQCTGLKDKNGKLIFEGDILDKTDWCNGVQDYENGAVEFGLLGDSDGYRATDYLCWKAGDSSLTDVHSDSMIVGNIYENPGLLKE